MNNLRESELIARLISSTKRKKRNFSIIEIATDISDLKKMLGSLEAVSKIVGISQGMLNQFLSVSKLPSTIQNLVHERKIDSVAIVFLLSKFSEEDIIRLSPLIIEGAITSQELKILIPYRKQHKNKDILELLEEIKASKNIKVSVIRLPADVIQKTQEELSEIIASIVGRDNLLEIQNNEGLLDIKILKEGEEILRKKAKEKQMTLSGLMITLIK